MGPTPVRSRNHNVFGSVIQFKTQSCWLISFTGDTRQQRSLHSVHQSSPKRYIQGQWMPTRQFRPLQSSTFSRLTSMYFPSFDFALTKQNKYSKILNVKKGFKNIFSVWKVYSDAKHDVIDWLIFFKYSFAQVYYTTNNCLLNWVFLNCKESVITNKKNR